ncbi:MAG: TatD family hydrolase [Bacteroidetes bacterium]|nr:TatD family hydrolase [Bacteroidota bacterium]
MIIDTHAHFYFPEILENIEEIIDNSLKAGVEKIIMPAVDFKSCETILGLVSKYNMLYAALGLHPGDIKNLDESEFYKLEPLLKENKVVGIGETGLDYYWDKTYNDKQKVFFRNHLELAAKYNLPVIIHTRDSVAEAIEITNEYRHRIKAQFHCFSGNTDELKQIISCENFYVSYCGNITYKKSDSVTLVENTPVEKMLSETDSPFLAPMPHRGKKNQPAYVVDTIRKIAKIKNMDENTLIDAIHKNTEIVFPGIFQ